MIELFTCWHPCCAPSEATEVYLPTYLPLFRDVRVLHVPQPISQVGCHESSHQGGSFQCFFHPIRCRSGPTIPHWRSQQIEQHPHFAPTQFRLGCRIIIVILATTAFQSYQIHSHGYEPTAVRSWPRSFHTGPIKRSVGVQQFSHHDSQTTAESAVLLPKKPHGRNDSCRRSRW